MGGGGGAWKDIASAFNNSVLLDSSFSLFYVGGGEREGGREREEGEGGGEGGREGGRRGEGGREEERGGEGRGAITVPTVGEKGCPAGKLKWNSLLLPPWQ